MSDEVIADISRDGLTRHMCTVESFPAVARIEKVDNVRRERENKGAFLPSSVPDWGWGGGELWGGN